MQSEPESQEFSYSLDGRQIVTMGDPREGSTHPFQRGIFPVVFEEHDQNKTLIRAQALGTAFVIGPSILMTARHLVDAATELAEDAGSDHTVRLVAVFISNVPAAETPAPWYVPLDITRVFSHPETDLALAHFQEWTVDGRPPRFTLPRLTMDVPANGSHVVGMGYPEFFATPYADGMLWNPTLTGVTGVIEEYTDSRGGLVTWPAVQSDFPCPSGMSGAPICDSQGRVCGVVTSSMEHSDGSYTSWASMLKPMLGIVVPGFLDDRVWRNFTAQDLMDLGGISSDGSHRAVPRSETLGVVHKIWSRRSVFDEEGARGAIRIEPGG